MTLLAALFALHGAQAQSAGAGKIAADLARVIAAPTTPKLNWAKDVNGQRQVKALIVSNSIDPDLTDLRAAVLAAGGSIHMRYMSRWRRCRSCCRRGR